MSQLDLTATSARILEFIRSRYPQADVSADQDIFQVGFINSLFAMELVMFVEKTFDVTVPNEELRIDNFRTADAMAALVGRVAGSDLAQV
jgi:methoxymalonate biosynthesis acyl carrier protein